MDRSGEKETKSDQTGSGQDGEKTAVKAEIRMRFGNVYLPNIEEIVVAVANQGRGKKGFDAFLIVFDFGLN